MDYQDEGPHPAHPSRPKKAGEMRLGHTHHITFLAVVALSIVSQIGPAVSGEVPNGLRSYTCYRAGEKISVDGVLSEKCWGEAPVANAFVDTVGKCKSTYETEVKMLWDEKNLYFAITVKDPDVWSTLAKRDDPLTDEEEAVEILVDANSDSQMFVRLAVNARGTVYDAFMVCNDSKTQRFYVMPQWDAKDSKVVVKVEGTLNDQKDQDQGWTAEWAIAIEDFTTRPHKKGVADEEKWRLNFGRTETIRSQNNRKERQSWSHIYGPQFYLPTLFGQVVFTEKVVGQE